MVVHLQVLLSFVYSTALFQIDSSPGAEKKSRLGKLKDVGYFIQGLTSTRKTQKSIFFPNSSLPSLRIFGQRRADGKN